MSEVSGQPGLRWWEEIRPQIMVVAFFCILLFALSLQNRVTDADFWWHLRTGQWILEQGHIPRVDDYSYTAQGELWIAHSWLSDVGMYALYRYVGAFSLHLLRSLLHVATFALLLKLVWERWPRLGGALALILIAFVSSAKFWLLRPNSISLALSIGLLYLWDRYKRGRWRSVWLLPPLMALWANLHSGWIYGFVLLVALFVGEGISLGRAGHIWPTAAPLERKRWLQFGLFTLLSVPAVLINPYGPHLLVYPFRYFVGGITLHTNYVVEWLSPNFHQPSNLLFALLLLLLIGTLAWRRCGVGPAETLALLVFIGLSLRSVRAAGIAIPLITWTTAGVLGQGVNLRIVSSSRRGAWPRPKRAVIQAWYGVTLLVTLLLLFSIGWEFVNWGQRTGFLEENPDMRQAITVLQNLPPARMFNSYNLGGYLIWHLYPEQRVFIDGRADLYGDEIFAQYMEVWQTQATWAEVLDQYQVQLAICGRHTPLATLLLESDSWDPVYRNATTAVFQRTP